MHNHLGLLASNLGESWVIQLQFPITQKVRPMGQAKTGWDQENVDTQGNLHAC